MLNPQTLINKVQSIKKLFPETTFFFTGFPATRTNIPPNFNIALTRFTVCVVTVIIHPGTTFWTQRMCCSAENSINSILKLIRIVPKNQKKQLLI